MSKGKSIENSWSKAWYLKEAHLNNRYFVCLTGCLLNLCHHFLSIFALPTFAKQWGTALLLPMHALGVMISVVALIAVTHRQVFTHIIEKWAFVVIYLHAYLIFHGLQFDEPMFRVLWSAFGFMAICLVYANFYFTNYRLAMLHFTSSVAVVYAAFWGDRVGMMFASIFAITILFTWSTMFLRRRGVYLGAISAYHYARQALPITLIKPGSTYGAIKDDTALAFPIKPRRTMVVMWNLPISYEAFGTARNWQKAVSKNLTDAEHAAQQAFPNGEVFFDHVGRKMMLVIAAGYGIKGFTMEKAALDFCRKYAFATSKSEARENLETLQMVITQSDAYVGAIGTEVARKTGVYGPAYSQAHQLLSAAPLIPGSGHDRILFGSGSRIARDPSVAHTIGIRVQVHALSNPNQVLRAGSSEITYVDLRTGPEQAAAS